MLASRRYLISTLGYGLCVVAGAFALTFFALKQLWILSLLGLVFALIALDNFLCGSRACSAGVAKTKKHYILPPFLRKRKA